MGLARHVKASFSGDRSALFAGHRSTESTLKELGWLVRRRRGHNPDLPQWRMIGRLLRPLDHAREGLGWCPGTRDYQRAVTGRTRWAMRWKPALNAFAITFGDRFPAAETY